MAQIIPIYIPTYINSEQYAPARVLPRLFFYNGLIQCQRYYIEDGSLTTAGISEEQTAFPYFDNYNVVSGSFPTIDSLSLLFNNEAASYGQVPTQNLYTTYWEKYINLLYNPRTRLLNASAIIPLADYFDMELNDIVSFRGNYYHLRAINEYSLQTGECTIQLLGPIIGDTISQNASPCDFDFSVANQQTWTVTKCDNSSTFTGVTFNTTSSLNTGKVITWGTPGLLEGCYTISASMDTPDLTGSIIYNIFDNCDACGAPTTTTTTTTTVAPTTTTTTLEPDVYYTGVDCCGNGITCKIMVKASVAGGLPEPFPYGVYVPGKGCFNITAFTTSSSVDFAYVTQAQKLSYFYGEGACSFCVSTYGCPTTTTTAGPTTTTTAGPTTTTTAGPTTTTTLAPTTTTTT
jgi:hypothetical protein